MNVRPTVAWVKKPVFCFLKLVQSEHNEMLRKSASNHVFTLVAFFFWVSYGHNVERQMLRLFEQINGGQQKIALNIQLFSTSLQI